MSGHDPDTDKCVLNYTHPEPDYSVCDCGKVWQVQWVEIAQDNIIAIEQHDEISSGMPSYSDKFVYSAGTLL